MNKPIVKSGKFHAGADFQCGENVVVDVAEEVVLGDRCVIPDNARFEGRRITFGDDCYVYGWDFSRLDIGRGRIDEAGAVLNVGSRCTFHQNRIDLARPVTVGDDVGLSPDVVVYTHGYWLSPLKGYPCTYGPVDIGGGSIIGFRSVVLPFAVLGRNTVIGAQSVVTGRYYEGKAVYAGDPAKLVGPVKEMPLDAKMQWLEQLLDEYDAACRYRQFFDGRPELRYPTIRYAGCLFDVEALTAVGEEDARTDDFRWHLFRHGLRFYTRRPFCKLRRKTA